MFISSTQKNGSNSRSLRISYFTSVCKTNNVLKCFYSSNHSAGKWPTSVSSMVAHERESLSFSICGHCYVEKRIFINP
jgi:hypothetical protein